MRPIEASKDEGGRMKGEKGKIRQAPSAVSAVKRLAVWARRRLCRVTEPTPQELIRHIAQKARLNVMILPANITDPMPTVRLVYMIAERAGLVVTLACPKKGMTHILQNKINTAGRN